MFLVSFNANFAQELMYGISFNCTNFVITELHRIFQTHATRVKRIFSKLEYYWRSTAYTMSKCRNQILFLFLL